MTAASWGVFAALGMLWGMPYFFIKVALVELHPLFIVWSRLTLAAAVLLPIAWRRGALGALRDHWMAVLAFALIEFVIPFCAITIGEQWIDSSVTGMLIALVPLSMAVIARFFGLHERMGMTRFAGLVIGLAGVALLLGFGSVRGALGWLGVGCMVIATLGYAIGPLIVQRHLHGVDSSGAVAASLAAASLLMLPPALLAWPSQVPSPLVVGAIAFLGMACTAVAMLLMFYLIRSAGASRAAVITYINPAVATLLGVIVLQESLRLSGYAAFALILLGSWLATRGAARVAH
jgi:drug/metabolite transporter (DMT)-like permease